MTSTTSPAFNFAQNIPNMIFGSFEDGMKQGAHMLWSALMTVLSQHWQLIMGVIFVVFIITTLKAMIGRWGMLGSLLYNLFYFGTLFIIGLIWGPEVFLNDYFNAACTIILYPVCYFMVGYILKRLGIRQF